MKKLKSLGRLADNDDESEPDETSEKRLSVNRSNLDLCKMSYLSNKLLLFFQIIWIFLQYLAKCLPTLHHTPICTRIIYWYVLCSRRAGGLWEEWIQEGHQQNWRLQKVLGLGEEDQVECLWSGLWGQWSLCEGLWYVALWSSSGSTGLSSSSCSSTRAAWRWNITINQTGWLSSSVRK